MRCFRLISAMSLYTAVGGCSAEPLVCTANSWA
jgi:hypothetical protein